MTIGQATAGRGGRNTGILLGFALAVAAEPAIWAIAGDSDGTEDAAGGIVAPDRLSRGRAKGHDARAHLSTHDSYTYFDRIGDLIRTGPTLTNVNDIRAILIA